MNTAETTNQSAALSVAAMFDNDGQRFTTEGGRTFAEICASFGSSRVRRDSDAYRYSFPDGSALAVAGAAWDLCLAPSEPRCYCWAGELAHAGGCPLAPAPGWSYDGDYDPENW